jgi:hypothetical protein
MAPPSTHLAACVSTSETKDAESHKETYEQLAQVVSSTYEAAASGIVMDFHRHPDGWYTALPVMVGALVAHRHFEARDTDVLVATIPKSGTTWIKALLYAAAHRTVDRSSILQQLASHNSHQLVPSLETQVYTKYKIPDHGSLPAPRLFGTHIPTHSLPPSVAASGCKVHISSVLSNISLNDAAMQAQSSATTPYSFAITDFKACAISS